MNLVAKAENDLHESAQPQTSGLAQDKLVARAQAAAFVSIAKSLSRIVEMIEEDAKG